MLQAAVVVFGVIVIVFILYHLFPGGAQEVAHQVLGSKAQPYQIAAFIRQQGLDQPLWDQFWILLRHVFTLNLGYSYTRNQAVWQLIMDYLPKTLLLVGSSLVLALIVAIPLGVLQVLRRNKPIDYTLTGASFFFYAMPTFFLGLVLQEIFGIDLHLLPPDAPSASTVGAIVADWPAMILPVVTLAMVTIAGFSRYMRSSMMEQLTEDYVRTARAKGVSRRRVIYGHALRNALIPIVTLLGLSLPGVVSGAVITETVFNYPGMGLLFYNSATTSDFPTIIGTTLVAAVATVIGSLLADIVYAVLDPRIRYV